MPPFEYPLFEPGQIVLVDSNMGPLQDYLGLVVDTDFWFEQARDEGLYPSELLAGALEDSRNRYLRVLGSRTFPRSWLHNEAEIFEPDPATVFHYRFSLASRLESVDLRGFLGAWNLRDFPGALFSHISYGHDALGDARLVYEFLDGRRAQSPSSPGHFGREEKMLRLLARAIPQVS